MTRYFLIKTPADKPSPILISGYRAWQICYAYLHIKIRAKKPEYTSIWDVASSLVVSVSNGGCQQRPPSNYVAPKPTFRSRQ